MTPSLRFSSAQEPIRAAEMTSDAQVARPEIRLDCMNKFSSARADTPSDPKHVPVARPKWLRMYFVLAGFDLLTVCISLFLNPLLSG